MTPLLSAIYEGHTECVSTLLKHVSKCFCVCPHYRPQTRFPKVMLLHLSVSHSVHGGGEYLGRYPPGSGEVPGQVHPWAGTPPLWAGTPPLWAGTPPSRYPHSPSSACWDTVNKRAVRILLECFLV